MAVSLSDSEKQFATSASVSTRSTLLSELAAWTPTNAEDLILRNMIAAKLVDPEQSQTLQFTEDERACLKRMRSERDLAIAVPAKDFCDALPES